jgi:hypothetical protein
VGPTSAPTTRRLEETNAAVSLAGTWFSQAKDVHSAGAAALAMDAGTSGTLTFSGTAVAWRGVRDAWSGQADVTLDGVYKGRIDLYSATEIDQAVLWSASGLSAGVHTLRIEVTGTQNAASGGAWVWIDAFDVTSGAGASTTNLAVGKAVTSTASCSAATAARKAVNGSYSGGLSDKWCSTAATPWMRVDLGTPHTLSRFVVRHAGAGGESPGLNTRGFRIEVSHDGASWRTVVSVHNNTAGASGHTITPTNARYVRLVVTQPTQTTGIAARIYELQVMGR